MQVGVVELEQGPDVYFLYEHVVETSTVAKVNGSKSHTWWSEVSSTLRPSRVSCMGESLSLEIMESTDHSPGLQVLGRPHAALYSPSSMTEV